MTNNSCDIIQNWSDTRDIVLLNKERWENKGTGCSNKSCVHKSWGPLSKYRLQAIYSMNVEWRTKCNGMIQLWNAHYFITDFYTGKQNGESQNDGEVSCFDPKCHAQVPDRLQCEVEKEQLQENQHSETAVLSPWPELFEHSSHGYICVVMVGHLNDHTECYSTGSEFYIFCCV